MVRLLALGYAAAAYALSLATLVYTCGFVGNLGTPTALVADAHKAGLKVQPYTFRNENPFLPTNLRSSADPAAFGDVFSEEAAFFKAGVDGFFADQPDTALESLHAFLGR